MDLKKLVFVVLAIVVFSGCQKSEEKRNYSLARGGRTGTGTNQTPYYGSTNGGGVNTGAGKAFGEITRGTSSQAQFQQALTALLAPQTITPGFTSGDSNQNTGVRFWGNADVTSGRFNPSGSTGMNYQIKGDTAAIEIYTFDEYANQYGAIRTRIATTDESGNSVGSFQAGGYVQGNYAQIAWGDSAGWIILEGYFNQTYFQGTVWYGTGSSNMQVLGNFAVPTCGFFRC